MELNVLGPLEIRYRGRTTAIGSRLQRTLLTMLAMAPNRAVSTDLLTDALWGDDGWRRGNQRLWFHVSKLRSALAGAPLEIDHTGRGYALAVDEAAVDVHRFERLVESAFGGFVGDPARTESLLTSALELWRGEPFADAGSSIAATIERARLEELRLTALERRIDARLILGIDTVGEAEALVAEQPFREPLWDRLLRSLDSAGRPLEALDRYEVACAIFQRELGVDPSHDLRQLTENIRRRLAGGRLTATAFAGPL